MSENALRVVWDRGGDTLYLRMDGALVCCRRHSESDSEVVLEYGLGTDAVVGVVVMGVSKLKGKWETHPEYAKLPALLAETVGVYARPDLDERASANAAILAAMDRATGDTMKADPVFAAALSRPLCQHYKPLLARLEAFTETLASFGYDVSWSRPRWVSDNGATQWSLLLSGQEILCLWVPWERQERPLRVFVPVTEARSRESEVSTEAETDALLVGLLQSEAWRSFLLSAECLAFDPASRTAAWTAKMEGPKAYSAVWDREADTLSVRKDFTHAGSSAEFGDVKVEYGTEGRVIGAVISKFSKFDPELLKTPAGYNMPSPILHTIRTYAGRRAGKADS